MHEVADSKRLKKDEQKENMFHALSHKQALLLPVISSCTLLMIFFLFKYIQYVLLASTLVSAVYCLYFAIVPLTTRLGYSVPMMPQGRLKSGTWDFLNLSSSYSIISLTIASLLTAIWVVTGSWVLNNLIGMALCITFLSHVRLPNFKICVALFIALFMYDVFWVFFSDKIFGENVMTAAATQQADNPTYKVAEALNVPTQLLASKLDLPMKLIFPQDMRIFQSLDIQEGRITMLGCGDIAIPGLLVILSFTADVSLLSGGGSLPTTNAMHDTHSSYKAGIRFSRWKEFTYTLMCMGGYLLGLVLALVCGMTFNAPQPALFYLVPCTLGCVLLAACRRKSVKILWNGEFVFPT